MCLNIGTPKNHHFPFGTNEKNVVLGVPILKHFRVDLSLKTDLRSRCVLDVFGREKTPGLIIQYIEYSCWVNG